MLYTTDRKKFNVRINLGINMMSELHDDEM